MSRLGTLGLLTLSYMVGEVAHFLPAITSKDLAGSLEFGDQRCYSSAGRSDQGQNQCSKLDSETGEYFYYIFRSQSERTDCSFSNHILGGHIIINSIDISIVTYDSKQIRVSHMKVISHQKVRSNLSHLFKFM